MDLCRSMTRTRVKGNGSKAASSPATEPNFYIMDPCYETHPNDGDYGDNTADEECLEDHTGRVFEFPTTNTPELEDSSEDMSDDEIVMHPEKDGSTILGPAPMDVFSSLAPFFPVATPYRIGRSGSMSSSDTSSVENVKSSLPIVSPCESRAVVSPPGTPKQWSSLSIPLSVPIMDDEPSQNSRPTLEFQSGPTVGDFRSGDQIFFEGLPFHYLETKDVEADLTPTNIEWAA
jgi:hypothetical protein